MRENRRMSENTSNARRWAWILAGAVLLIGGSVLAWKYWQDFQEIKRQNAALTARADQSAQAAQLAAEEAARASARAEDAAKQANEAESIKESALDEKAQAEQARLQAEM